MKTASDIRAVAQVHTARLPFPVLVMFSALLGLCIAVYGGVTVSMDTMAAVGDARIGR